MNTMVAQDLNIYLDSHGEHVLSLKDLINDQFSLGIPEKISLAITIAPHVIINLNDDLILFDSIMRTSKYHHKLEFFIHESSTLVYDMKTIPSFDPERFNDLPLMQAQDGALIEKELIFRLVGKHAQARVKATCYGTGSRVFKYNTLQDHQVAQTTSALVLKSVLDDASKLICNSMIQIHKDAQQANAAQENKNIILGKKARAVSVPQLEIEANDVKCKHGAAVSKLDNDHLFYLQSRGIDEKLTRKMLIQAFLS